MNRRRVFLQLAFLFLLGLIPFLWFKNGYIITGHDSGLPLDPIAQFSDRLFAWTQRFGLGLDQSGVFYLPGAFFLNATEALPSLLGLSLQMVQKIEFSFWFVLPGLTMYFFANRIWPDKKYLPFIASLIYMINYYLIQGWFVAERTKFSIYAATPIVMYFLISYLLGRTKLWWSILISGVVLSLLNGGGSIPLYGGLILTILTTYLYFLIVDPGRKTFLKIIYFSIGTGLIFVLLNFYWILPGAFNIFRSFGSTVADAGGVEGAIGWERYVSVGTTFMNLFRGQGIPEWYLNIYHPYAGTILHNPFFVIISIAFPILMVAPMLLAKSSKDRLLTYLMVLMSLVGLFFSAGTRSQFGNFFELMLRHLPGFLAFRNPYYKFDYTVWFSYAVLIGLSTDYLLLKFEERFVNLQKIKLLFPSIPLVLFTLVLLIYHYPVLSGNFFDYSHEPGNELSTRVKVPQYIFDFDAWVKKQDPDTRFLILPELGNQKFVSYDWGYWSLAPLTSVLTRNSFVWNVNSSNKNEKTLVNGIYAALKGNDTELFNRYAQILGVDKVILEEDFNWSNPLWGTTNPKVYADVVDKSSDFTLEKTFGKWKVYSIKRDNLTSRLTLQSGLIFLDGDISRVLSFPLLETKFPIFISESDKAKNSYFAKEASDILLLPQCVDCELKGVKAPNISYDPRILPGSLFYWIIQQREAEILGKARDFESKANYFVTVSDRRLVEVKRMIDLKRSTDQIEKSLENHLSSIQQLKNLFLSNPVDTKAEDNFFIRTITEHLLYQGTTIESLYGDAYLSPVNKSSLIQSYDQLSSLIFLAKQRLWITDDAIQKRYISTLPEDGTYELYVDKNSLVDPANHPEGIELIFKDDPSKTFKPLGSVGNWLYFGTKSFKSKIAYLQLNDLTASNILDSVKAVFPQGSNGIDVSTDKNEYTFKSDSSNLCFYFPVDNLAVGDKYVVSFEYRNLTRESSIAFYADEVQTTVPTLSLRDKSLTSSTDWNKYSYVAEMKTSKLNIGFCNGFIPLEKRYKKAQSILNTSAAFSIVRNIQLSHISFPTVAMFKEKTNNGINVNPAYTKKNPAEYDVSINPSVPKTTLTMKEAFSNQWYLCLKGECLSDSDKVHFASAGLFNSWYFKDGLSGNVKLYFFPQILYREGAIVSISTVLALMLGSYIYSRWRKKN